MRRRLGCAGSLLVLLLIAAAVYAVENGGDYLLFAPWAYGWFGQPTLTGTWEGTVKTQSGMPYVIFLQLDRDRDSRGAPVNSRGQADIDGHAFWCARGIRGGTSTVFGHANRSASNVVLEIQKFQHLPAGLFPIRFQGAWRGSTLALRIVFYPSLGPKQGYTVGAPGTGRPVPGTLHKKGYSVYQATCAHV